MVYIGSSYNETEHSSDVNRTFIRTEAQ